MNEAPGALRKGSFAVRMSSFGSPQCHERPLWDPFSKAPKSLSEVKRSAELKQFS